MHYSELESLYDKFGGKFRFAVLLQKRVQQLVAGERRLVSIDTKDPVAIAIAEAKEGKIWLEAGDVKAGDAASAPKAKKAS